MSKDGPNMSGKGERFEKKGESVEKNEEKYEEYEVSEEEKIISEKIRRLARRERITVTDPEAYQKALTAIRKIEEVFSSRRFEEARPEFSYSYDRLFGTMLGFEVIITEYGVIMGSDKLREIARLLPPDCSVSIRPRTDHRVSLLFSFRGVRKIIWEEGGSDAPHTS